MSVAPAKKGTTSKASVRPEDLDLEFLVNFVNSDPARLNSQDHNQSLIKWFLKRYKLNPPGGVRKAKRLQRRVKKDILDVIVPDRRGVGIDVHHSGSFHRPYSPVLKCLIKLILIVNDMDLTTKISFSLSNGDYSFGTVAGKIFINPEYRNLGRNRQGILSIGGEKWIFCESHSFADSPDKQLYMTLAEALKNGEFSKLKMCHLPDCGKIFIQRNFRRKFCYGTNCKDMFFNKQKQEAGHFAEWQRNERRNRRKEKLQAESQAAEQKAFERFCKFIKNQDRPTIKKIGTGNHLEGWKIFGKWEKQRKGGVLLKELWKTKLTDKQRQIFEV